MWFKSRLIVFVQGILKIPKDDYVTDDLFIVIEAGTLKTSEDVFKKVSAIPTILISIELTSDTSFVSTRVKRPRRIAQKNK